MHIYKNRPKNGGEFTFVWIAVDRESGEIIYFELGDRTKTTYLKLAFRLVRAIKSSIYVLMITPLMDIIKSRLAIVLQSTDIIAIVKKLINKSLSGLFQSQDKALQ